MPIETFLALGTDEEIRGYFRQAQHRFRNYDWDSAYGGSPWAEIAQAGYDMWKEDLSSGEIIMALDHVFDLQHNSGMIFDKWPEIIKSAASDKEVLDIKYLANDFQELTSRLLNFSGATLKLKNYVNKTQSMMEQISRMKTLPRRERLSGD